MCGVTVDIEKRPFVHTSYNVYETLDANNDDDNFSDIVLQNLINPLATVWVLPAACLHENKIAIKPLYTSTL